MSHSSQTAIWSKRETCKDSSHFHTPSSNGSSTPRIFQALISCAAVLIFLQDKGGTTVLSLEVGSLFLRFSTFIVIDSRISKRGCVVPEAMWKHRRTRDLVIIASFIIIVTFFVWPKPRLLKLEIRRGLLESRDCMPGRTLHRNRIFFSNGLLLE